MPNLKKTELMQGTAIILEWDDTKSRLGWSYRHNKTPHEVGHIRSIGYLVDSSKECITITNSMDAKGSSLDDLSIPVGCITNLTVLPDEFGRGKPEC
jgi:hypothetical protein